MPPKPTPRSVSSSANVTKDAIEAKLMPPPPDPRPASRLILEPEATALATCLKNAAVKTGQVYAFFADAHRLGIQAHAPKPPRSLTASLGREIEKYDQIVDAMEAQINRAIAVLQRDLEREELRIKQAAEVLLATKAGSVSPTSKVIPVPPTDATPKQENVPLPTPNTSPRPSSSAGPSRRPSAISISSLQRPALPLKLDLSSSALRINPEEAAAMFSSALASPVTLAPKSARPMGPNEFSPDLMAAFVASAPNLNERPVDIDLTIGDLEPAPAATAEGKLSEVGNSADKPIELDLENMDIDMSDMTDLFGDATEPGASNAGQKGTMNDLFTSNVGQLAKNSNNMENQADFLNVVGDTNATDDILASLGVTGVSHTLQPTKDGNLHSQITPSPGVMLASFDNAGSTFPTVDPNSGDPSFDLDNIDFSGFSPSLFNNTEDSDMKFMDEFMPVGSAEEGGEKRMERVAVDQTSVSPAI